MSDIFLSYANEDLARVSPLIRALEQHGWSVWWDRTIPPGKTFDEVIEQALAAARCVVVVWSRASVASRWVRTEATEGLQKNALVPVLLDADLTIPLAFRLVQAARLLDWQGTVSHPEFEKLVQALHDLLGPPSTTETQPVVEEPSSPVTPLQILSTEPQQKAENSAIPEPLPPPVAPGMRRRQSLLLLGGGAGVLLAGSYLVFFNAKKTVSLEEPVRTPVPTPEPPKPFTNSIGMEFLYITAGQFEMGSTKGASDERPVHTVRISQPFYLGKYEVTQRQWQAIMGSNPSGFKGDDNLPVENVSWEDVQEFLRRLNAKEGGAKYRLPTEAEWEYAARAGSSTDYSFGNDKKQLGSYAWFAGNAGGKTHPAGKLQPNAWGLYDMHGNVWEWVQD